MAKIEKSILINAPVEKVFEFMSKPIGHKLSEPKFCQ
jgi:uncharacterized protein YndB with AHSA1/START domain